MQKSFLKEEEIHTVYFGGGTPSLLSTKDLEMILQALRYNFVIHPGAEITLEANPDDISLATLSGWRALGINRLSLGIQSFYNEELIWMNRAHGSEQAERCLELLPLAGFDNYSIDLIYGSPLLTDDMWQHNVETALRYGAPHLSCYALTVEEKTPLHKRIQLKKTALLDGDKGANQFTLLMHWLKKAGYEHYEVSNFAKPGFRSRHNSAYWKGIPYLGIGPSAHSFNGNHRQWNVSNNQQYMQSLRSGLVPSETEVLTATSRFNEYIMISLRTAEGISLHQVEAMWGSERRIAIGQQVLPYFDKGFIKLTHESVQLTEEGMLMADGIASDLFLLG